MNDWETNTGADCAVGDGTNFVQSFDSDTKGEYTVYMSKADFKAKYPGHVDFELTY